MVDRSVVSWSSGKDCFWALVQARRSGGQVVGLLTTVDETSEAVSHHGVPRALVSAQATELGLPLDVVAVPGGSASATYGERMAVAVSELVAKGVRAVVFGDLFLEELRSYRELKLRGSGLEAQFPLWGRPTDELAREMLAGGLRSTIVSVDLRRLPLEALGQRWDESFLASLPPGVDPCGENGEFHTFTHDGPGFRSAVEADLGQVTVSGDHAHIALIPRPRRDSEQDAPRRDDRIRHRVHRTSAASMAGILDLEN